MHIEYNMIIKKYGHKFDFLQQHVGDGKLKEKRRL